MDNDNATAWPDWAGRFLDALRDGNGVRAACRIAGVTSSTPYALRDRDDAFRAEWDAIQPVDGRRKRKTGPAPRREAGRIDAFIDEMAHSSNVAAAAAVAGLPVSRVYRLRRTDPDFAARWYAALAEGYDNLEMELLSRLREGRLEDVDAEGNRRKFDMGTALRCLTAHRENVAREKGRRTLADEAATIQSINRKIDELRLRGKKGEAEVRRARKRIAQRTANNG